MERITVNGIAAYPGESDQHIALKRLLADGLRHYLPEVEPWIQVNGVMQARRPDIGLRLSTGEYVAIEVQHSKKCLKQFQEKESDYSRVGVLPLWVFERWVIDPVITRRLLVGYERTYKGSGMLCLAVQRLIDQQRFVHVWDGERFNIVTASTFEAPRTYAQEMRKHMRVEAIHPVLPPFDITLRDGRFPRLAEHYD